MQLTLLRHAESEYNQKGLLQGRIDCNLSKKGLAQTREKAKKFNSTNYDICFTSPLKRTLLTAQILVPDLEIICDNRIIERSLGDWEDTPTSDEKKFLLNNINSTPPNGESTTEITKRVLDFIDFLKANYNDKRILIITHAGIVYAIQVALGMKIKPINNLEELIINIENIK